MGTMKYVRCCVEKIRQGVMYLTGVNRNAIAVSKATILWLKAKSAHLLL